MSFLGELIVRIAGDNSDFAKSIKDADKKLTSFEDNVKKSGRSMKEFGSKMSMVASAPIMGVFIAALASAKDTNTGAGLAMKGLESNTKDLMQSIAQGLTPMITTLSDVIKGVAGYFNNLSDNQKSTYINMGLLIAAIGPLITIIGTFMSMGFAGIFMAVAAAVVAVTIAMKAMSEASGAAALSVKGLATENQKASKEFIAAVDSMSGVGRHFIEEYQQIAQNFQGMTTSVQDFAAALYKNTTESIAKTTGLTKDQANAIISDWRKSILSARDQELADNKDKYDKLLLIAVQAGQNQLAILKQQKIDEAAINKRYDDQQIADAQAISDKQIADAKAVADAGIEAVNKLREKQNEYLQVRSEEEITLAAASQAEADAADAAAQAEQNRINQLRADYEQFGNMIGSSIMPLFENLGEMIVNGSNTWDMFRKAGLSAVASIIEGLAQLWTAQAAAAYAASFLDFGASLPGALGYTAAAAAAFLAAGVIKGLASLATGGLIMPQGGGQIVRMAEGGYPEYAIPERKDVLGRLASLITKQQAAQGATINNSYNPRMRLQIGHKEFDGFLEDEIDSGRIKINPRSIKRR